MATLMIVPCHFLWCALTKLSVTNRSAVAAALSDCTG
jgi:hypothetical protein